MLAAATRVFARVGLLAATIEQIAQEGGVTRQAIYEQFGDKNALFDTVVGEMGEEMLAAFGTPADVSLDVDDVAWLRRCNMPVHSYFADHPIAVTLLREAERVRNPAFVHYRARLTAAYTEAVRERLARRGCGQQGRLPAVLVALFFAMSSTLITMPWEGDPPDSDTLLDLLSEFTVGGLERLAVARQDVIGRLG
ncbi:MAG: TetR/AcrR family transcriptional regulator [Pseudonocardia sp.]|nr:TetR/AcrR family transcriptional regulator [Pseudonocardia sp.]MBO0875806.1 TetR/AcrR family transcriptional regulator [Pseudonocardia sp.]